MKVINPANEALIQEIKEDDNVSFSLKLEMLKKGQLQWREKPVKERMACIIRFGELVKENIAELARILTSETGKPIQQAINEIKGAHNRIEHLEKYAEKWLATEVITSEGPTREEIAFEPLGVIANISAWNFPYNVGYNVFLYALAAGNAVLYKPSEYASLTGIKIRDLLWEAGVPKNVFDCVIGPGNVGEMLLSADLDGYFFTGSYPTGVHIAQKVASKLVPVQLELGGKDPLYVADDIKDIRQAAINAAEGAFYNNGQSCCAVERIYVHEKIYDKFLAFFIEEVEAYTIGDPLSEDTYIGPLTRKDQLEFILDQIDEALTKGAKLETGGETWGTKGYFLKPAVLSQVQHNMSVMKEESFGPIIGIQRVGSDEEAINLMQDTEYGLTAAVFSQSESRAKKIMKQLSTGTVYWNCCDRVSPGLPWSGRKNSGLGMTLSYMGIRAFVQPKSFHLRDE